MPKFHPILTTDYFEFGTSLNHLEKEGCAVEMGDAVLGLAIEERKASGKPTPNWAIVRNCSDPQINGLLKDQPKKESLQVLWAVYYYSVVRILDEHHELTGHLGDYCGAVMADTHISRLRLNWFLRSCLAMRSACRKNRSPSHTLVLTSASGEPTTATTTGPTGRRRHQRFSSSVQYVGRAPWCRRC